MKSLIQATVFLSMMGILAPTAIGQTKPIRANDPFAPPAFPPRSAGVLKESKAKTPEAEPFTVRKFSESDADAVLQQVDEYLAKE
ncbi:MAG: hypothetical protein AAGJ83_07830 [Planctomycetota bacterium]